MTLHRMLAAALVLLHPCNVHSEAPVLVGLGGVFDATADETRFAGLADYTATAVDDEEEYSGDKALLRSREKEKRRKKNRSHRSASTFGTSLFAHLCTNSSGNVLLSPLSVYNALTLVKDGASRGSDNEAQLRRVLGPPPVMEPTDEEEDGDAAVTLRMASSVWANDLKSSYVDGVVATESADAFPLPTRYTPIDEWVDNKTSGMIRGFLGDAQIDESIVAMLVSAVYFKGSWTRAFDPAYTTDGAFVARDGTPRAARFMTAERAVPFIRGAPAAFAALFVLPHAPAVASMDAAIAGLASRPLSALLAEAREVRVECRLPRFRLAVGLDAPVALKRSLERMGLTEAFDGRIGDKFDDMSYDPTLTVDDVLHGAVLEVTEAGTEAAGATAVPTTSRSSRRLRTTFDRPFVVAVVHRATGTPVFIGRVEEPELVF